MKTLTRGLDPHKKYAIVCPLCSCTNYRELTKEQLSTIPAFTCDGCDRNQPITSYTITLKA